MDNACNNSTVTCFIKVQVYIIFGYILNKLTKMDILIFIKNMNIVNLSLQFFANKGFNYIPIMFLTFLALDSI